MQKASKRKQVFDKSMPVLFEEPGQVVALKLKKTKSTKPKTILKLKYAVNSLLGTKNIEIWGLSKPSVQLRQKLQKNGFKWSEWNKVWVKKNYTSDDLSFAKSIAEKSENKKSKLAK